ncbi:glycerophosphodiester phosphodiesterase [Bifidobacterium samirii]|uniref:Glycerophosphodiester phosphodiesterase n=1 Tax=Bifidobacterium samirii TaxID=2306974 RepID=A0A430FR06_9BIFI|nr:glycerophosphodiester phosphodiesterase family protein [Bifidobacterium samirii]RSX55273.1 glycerophosphodiester phosphodiesterase [Bifidobacterium samirii]
MHANRTHTPPPSLPEPAVSQPTGAYGVIRDDSVAGTASSRPSAAARVHRGPMVAVAALLVCVIVACTMIHAVAALAFRTTAVAPLHDPIVIAHRGAAGDPENSLRAIVDAGVQGADYAEIDVRLTKDGVPVVFHDRRTGRLSRAGLDLLVSKTPLRRLRRMTMRHNDRDYHVPTLRQVLAAVRLAGGRPGLLLDLKTDDRHAAKLVAAVSDELDRADYDGGLMAMATSRKAIRLFARRNPQWPVGLCASGIADTVVWPTIVGGAGGAAGHGSIIDRDRAAQAVHMDGRGRERAAAASGADGNGNWNRLPGTIRSDGTSSPRMRALTLPTLRLDFIVARGRELDRGFLDAARERGIPVYAGAVSRQADAAALLRRGVSGLLGEETTPLSAAVSDYLSRVIA